MILAENLLGHFLIRFQFRKNWIEFFNSKKIRSKSDITISIDTTKAKVAKEALLNGANIINDISGFSFDNQMINVAQQFNCPIVLMHIKGDPKPCKLIHLMKML